MYFRSVEKVNFSYGGSATVVNFTLLGIVLNVSMRRFMFKS